MSKKTYEVTGPVPYAEHEPGEQFEAELPDDVERRALERGSIKVVTKSGKGKTDA
jgi:hypothetical protein